MSVLVSLARAAAGTTLQGPAATLGRVLPAAVQHTFEGASPIFSQARALSSASASSSGQVQREETLQEIRARIFEGHVGNGRRSGRQVLLRPLKGERLANWYFEVHPSDMPFLEDPDETA